MNKNYTQAILLLFVALNIMACSGSSTKKGRVADTISLAPAPVFNADSAMLYIKTQCAFGPRTPNSEAHERCADWIVAQFKSFGASVEEQHTDLKGYDGTKYHCRNIIALINPEMTDRVVIAAHYDSRLWADNDPDPANHHKPVPAANDGASGVAVMLEMARAIQELPIMLGIDFVCFDLEDQGTPQWAEQDDDEGPANFWCLGSYYWSEQVAAVDYRPRVGIVLDMVGGRGTSFSVEGYSRQVAGPVVNMVWHLAEQLGYGQYFRQRDGGYLTDDHIPMNMLANIPTIDIVPYCPDARSNFGDTWHTLADTPENIDPAILKAVGQTLLQLLYNDNAQ